MWEAVLHMHVFDVLYICLILTYVSLIRHYKDFWFPPLFLFLSTFCIYCYFLIVFYIYIYMCVYVQITSSFFTPSLSLSLHNHVQPSPPEDKVTSLQHFSSAPIFILSCPSLTLSNDVLYIYFGTHVSALLQMHLLSFPLTHLSSPLSCIYLSLFLSVFLSSSPGLSFHHLSLSLCH